MVYVGVQDVFVRDRVTGKTERVSVNSDGKQGNGVSQGPAISGDGRFVAFSSTEWFDRCGKTFRPELPPAT